MSVNWTGIEVFECNLAFLCVNVCCVLVHSVVHPSPLCQICSVTVGDPSLYDAEQMKQKYLPDKRNKYFVLLLKSEIKLLNFRVECKKC